MWFQDLLDETDELATLDRRAEKVVQEPLVVVATVETLDLVDPEVRTVQNSFYTTLL